MVRGYFPPRNQIYGVFSNTRSPVLQHQLDVQQFNSILALTPGVRIRSHILRAQYKTASTGFPGGTVDRNTPANEGDTGTSPGPGRSHMPLSN